MLPEERTSCSMVGRYQSLVMIDINNTPILALDLIKSKIPILNVSLRVRGKIISHIESA